MLLNSFNQCKSVISLAVMFGMAIIAFSSQAETDIYSASVNHSERLQSDSEHDIKRNPMKILPFTKIKRGDQVLELGAGGGYTTELVSRVVGDTGRIYAHFLYNKERLKNNRLSNVIPLRQHSLLEHKSVLEDYEVKDNQLDAIIVFFVLHDIYLNNEMSKDLLDTLYSTLKPGGYLIILDNAAKPNSGLENIGDLHRIDEIFVKAEMTKAGFYLDGTSNILRNKKDNHTKPWGDFQGYQDRFAYRFRKPEEN